MTPIEHIVVLGGGQAGGWAARTLRDSGYARQLSVVTDEAHDFYERPPLSKEILLGTRDTPELRLFTPDIVESLRIDWHRPCRATRIDRDAREVHLDNGRTLHYDRLLIATGSRPRVPDQDWLELEGVSVLRNIDDAVRLRQRLRRAQRLAVIGGGWIGLEVAAQARSLDIPVTVYERGTSLCGRSIAPEVADHLAALHRGHGVDLRLGCGDLQLSGASNGVDIETADSCDAHDVVLVGTGAELNTQLAHAAGLEMQAGILIDESGRTSDPAIYAAGDVAQHPKYGICLQSWANAQHQGIVSARGMLGLGNDQTDIPWLWSDQYGVNIQILGVLSGTTRCVRRCEGSGVTTFFHLDETHRLKQMVSFGNARAIKLGRRWMANARTLDPMELADPEFDLMTLR